MTIDLLKIADFNNRFADFADACYFCYLSIWSSRVEFNKKPIIRNSALEKGKEKDFWGISEGHTNDKTFDGLSRYETIPYLKYVLEELHKTNNDDNSDIIWFRFNGKVNILSKKYRYFVVIKETNKIVQFVTSYPIGEVKKEKIIKKWKEYWIIESEKSQSR